MSATVKTYLDHWSGRLRVPGLDSKARMAGRRLWGVSVHRGETDEVVDPLVGTLRLDARYLAMDWRGVLLGRGDRPGDVLRDEAALTAAASFFDTGADTPGVRR